MLYNLYRLDEQNSQGALISKAAFYPRNLNIVGKAPSMCGLHVLAVRLGNGSAHGGRFAMGKKNCLFCGKEFTPDLFHPYKKYCSRDCQQKAHHRQGRAIRTVREREARAQIACGVCGQMFTPTKQYRRYCSDSCKEKAYLKEREKANEYARTHFRPKQPTIRICKWCGEEFLAIGKKSFCCDDHMHMSIYGHEKPRERTKNCEYCGKEFITRNSNRKGCSAKCSHKIALLSKKEITVRRNTRKTKAFVENVYRLAIFKRDKWICQICGKKVNPNLSYPDPMSASLDHILPLANGGTHEPRNVQLAHWICNCKKSNTKPDQLRLLE